MALANTAAPRNSLSAMPFHWLAAGKSAVRPARLAPAPAVTVSVLFSILHSPGFRGRTHGWARAREPEHAHGSAVVTLWREGSMPLLGEVRGAPRTKHPVKKRTNKGSPSFSTVF